MEASQEAESKALEHIHCRHLKKAQVLTSQPLSGPLKPRLLPLPFPSKPLADAGNRATLRAPLKPTHVLTEAAQLPTHSTTQNRKLCPGPCRVRVVVAQASASQGRASQQVGGGFSGSGGHFMLAPTSPLLPPGAKGQTLPSRPEVIF